VHDRRPGEFARHEHRTFDVYVRVDEAGQQKAVGEFGRRRDRRDATIGDDDLRRFNPSSGNVDDLAYDRLRTGAHGASIDRSA
jgi:hypothetical protein